MSTVLPPPSSQYDATNEAETRRAIEQELLRLSSAATDQATTSLDGTGTVGKIPIWAGNKLLGDAPVSVVGGVLDFAARPTVGADSLAFLSELFTQADADARYALLAHTHSAAQITDFNAAGDARWWKLGETSLPGPLDIGVVTGIAPATLRVGGDIGASGKVIAGGEVDGLDFVLVGGSTGGGGVGTSIISVFDEGTLLSSTLSSLKFVGAGVTASAAGSDITITISFDQAAADARYSLLGHTHTAAEIVSGTLLDARLSANVAMKNTANIFTALNRFTSAASAFVAATQLTADTVARWAITTEGKMEWGAGAAAARDTNLYRSSAAVLKTDGEMDAADFVLVGGASGGGAASALISVFDEGVLKSSAVSSINFTGAGVAATAVGDAITVSITFDQAAADARYVQIANFNTLGDARYLQRAGGTLTGNLVFSSGSNILAASGAFTSQGSSSSFLWYPRDDTTNLAVRMMWYSAAGFGRLWHSTLGDLMQFNLTTGAGTVTQGLSVVAGTSAPYALTISGSPTSGQQIKLGTSSVWGILGTRQSGGDAVWTFNASQTSNADAWGQSINTLRSSLLTLRSTGLEFYTAPSGIAAGTMAAFWGSPLFSVSVGGIGKFAGGLTVTAGAISLPNASIADAALSSNVALLNGSPVFVNGVWTSAADKYFVARKTALSDVDAAVLGYNGGVGAILQLGSAVTNQIRTHGNLEIWVGGTALHTSLANGVKALSLAPSGVATFAGEVDGSDFVLVGGAAGGGVASALVTVKDEGTIISSALASINFTGSGITATAVGDAVTVAITFDQAAADARYSLLGHVHSGADITTGTVADARLSANIPWKNAGNIFTATQSIQTGALGNWALKLTMAGEAQPRLGVQNDGALKWSDGTTIDATLSRSAAGELTLGGKLKVTGLLNAQAGLTVTGVLTLPATSIADAALSTNIPKLNASANIFTGDVSAGVGFIISGTRLASATSSYNLLYRRDGVIGLYLGGADANNYYDNDGHIFRNRAASQLLTIDASGNISALGKVNATDFVLN